MKHLYLDFALSRAVTVRLVAGLFAFLVLAASPPAAYADGARLNINQASAEALEALPGVGPSRAVQIIELRDSLGGFSSYDQLLEVNGIGPRTLENMRAHVTLEGGVSELSGESGDAASDDENGAADTVDQGQSS